MEWHQTQYCQQIDTKQAFLPPRQSVHWDTTKFGKKEACFGLEPSLQVQLRSQPFAGGTFLALRKIWRTGYSNQ